MASKKSGGASTTSTKKASAPRAKVEQIFVVTDKKTGAKRYVKAMSGKEARSIIPTYTVKRAVLADVYEALRSGVQIEDARAPTNEPAAENVAIAAE